jgi:hypothetical protein
MEPIWDDLTPGELQIAQTLATQTFYWEKKDIGSYMLLARTVLELLVQYVKKNPQLRESYAEIIIITSYNMASMSWTGWDEEGITIDETHKLMGLQAAELNVRLATELNLPPERRQNGLWMLAAQHLAHGNTIVARETFLEQLSVIENANLPGRLMPEAWIAACNILDGSGSESELGDLLKTWAEDKEGEQQVGILKNAMEVFAT